MCQSSDEMNLLSLNSFFGFQFLAGKVLNLAGSTWHFLVLETESDAFGSCSIVAVREETNVQSVKIISKFSQLNYCVGTLRADAI